MVTRVPIFIEIIMVMQILIYIYRRNGYPSVKMGTPKIGYPGQSRVTIFIEISFHVNNIMVMEGRYSYLL